MGFYPELDNLTLDELIARFHGPPLDGPEYATAYYQEVASLIAHHGEPGLDFLMRELPERKEDVDRLRGILLGLTVPAQVEPSVPAILRSYLHDDRPLIVTEAITGLRLIGASEASDQVYALREHSSPHVRAAVLRYLSELHPERAWPVLLDALRDPDKLVREAAVDGLNTVVLRARDAIEDLLEREEDPDVREAAQELLEARTA